MQIYFAAPLFNEGEKKFNQFLVDKIEPLGFKVFLPQRDGIELVSPTYSELSPEEKRKAIFALDRDKVLECELFLFVLDGRVPDEGACVELGIAYAEKYLKNKNKLLVGLQTDNRAAFISSQLNPMVRGPFDYIFKTEEKLLAFLKDIKK